jgi:hypothetical protein
MDVGPTQVARITLATSVEETGASNSAGRPRCPRWKKRGGFTVPCLNRWAASHLENAAIRDTDDSPDAVDPGCPAAV